MWSEGSLCYLERWPDGAKLVNHHPLTRITRLNLARFNRNSLQRACGRSKRVGFEHDALGGEDSESSSCCSMILPVETGVC